jgi:hypothetical protein
VPLRDEPRSTVDYRTYRFPEQPPEAGVQALKPRTAMHADDSVISATNQDYIAWLILSDALERNPVDSTGEIVIPRVGGSGCSRSGGPRGAG